MAVIDIGTTSIRMAVAQLDEHGARHALENLQQAVSLGKDAFTKGYIEKATTEECVKGLKSFCRILREYHIPIDRRRVRAVATSAVREATNREAFLDRIYIATGLDVETVDEAEVNRFTYLSLQPFRGEKPFSLKTETLIIEVGGGSTELLALRHGRVSFSSGYRLGSLRMRQLLEDYRAPAVALREILENQIHRTVGHIKENLPAKGRINVLCMGGDARFAASHLLPDWDKTGLVELPTSSLADFTNEVLEYSVDDLVRKYHITYPEAETLGPALLTYVRLAEALKLRRIFVTSISMRDGVLAEMAADNAWAGEYTEQIVSSALNLGRKHHFDEPHAKHVARLARQFYRALQAEHGMPQRFELILHIAALLHEIGLFVSTRDHHKHSLYLIRNSDVFGLGAKDLLLAALVARYHRRSPPRPDHEEYNSLDRENRIAVSKLAAVLRVADALDRGHTQRIRNFELAMKDRQLAILVRNVPDLTLEQLAMEQKAEMFEQVYGMSVVLRKEAARIPDGQEAT